VSLCVDVDGDFAPLESDDSKYCSYWIGNKKEEKHDSKWNNEDSLCLHTLPLHQIKNLDNDMKTKTKTTNYWFNPLTMEGKATSYILIHTPPDLAT
jgi:hypothetical protein